MNRVLARSAAILDGADRFEDILNWQLFVAEQEAMLWGYNEKTDWVPGEPLYRRPRTSICDCSSCIEDGYSGRYEGNAIRPMFEEFDDGSVIGPMICEPCGVSWDRYEYPECWLCGKDYGFRRSPQRGIMGSTTYIDVEPLGPGLDLVRYIRSEIATMVNEEFRQLLWGDLRPSARELSGLFNERGITTDDRYTINEVVPYLPVKTWTPFERKEIDPKACLKLTYWLFDPLEPIAGSRWPVELPWDWRELKRTVPLPKMPEPTDWSAIDFVAVYPERRPITKQKRRRRV